MRILLIKFRHIGDVLLSTPLIENLKIGFPDAQIDFALNKDTKEMISKNPNINNIFAYDRKRIKDEGILYRIIDEYKFIINIISNGYDLVINLTEGDRGAIISRLSGAKIRLGIESRNFFLRLFHPYTYSIKKMPHIHAAIRDLKFLSFIHLQPKEKSVRIYFDDHDCEKVSAVLKNKKVGNFVVIHPVSRWMFKCWDDKRFAEVIDYIEKKGYSAVVTASPDQKELEKVSNILSYCKSKPLNLSGQLTLKELAALISKSTLFVGVDTAPMHMAAALNIPVVALFGPTDPVIWGPWDNDLGHSNYQDIKDIQYNGKHTVIQYPDDEIIYKNGKKISTAMMRILPEDVIGQINRVLD